MKKIISVLISISLLLLSCGCSEEKTIKKNETLLKYYETSEEYFDYVSSAFGFRLPKYWRGKYFVDVYSDHEDYYELKSYNENGTGLLFSIYSYDDKSYKKEHKDYQYMYYNENLKKHYVLVYPEKEEYVEENKEIYNNLKEAISIVLYTFKM